MSMDVQVDGDLLISRQRNWVLADVEAWLDLIQRVRQEQGRVFAILDARQGLAIAAAPRRRLVDGLSQHPMDLCVVVGDSLTTQAVVMLAARALSLLRKRPANLCFAGSLEQASELIAAARARLTAAPST